MNHDAHSKKRAAFEDITNQFGEADALGAVRIGRPAVGGGRRCDADARAPVAFCPGRQAGGPACMWRSPSSCSVSALKLCSASVALAQTADGLADPAIPAGRVWRAVRRQLRLPAATNGAAAAAAGQARSSSIRAGGQRAGAPACRILCFEQLLPTPQSACGILWPARHRFKSRRAALFERVP